MGEDVPCRDAQDAQNLRKVNGVIVKDDVSVTGVSRTGIVVPLALQYKVVKDAHRCSHAGVYGTYEAVRQRHWFRGLKQIVKDVFKHCAECIAIKGRPLTRDL